MAGGDVTRYGTWVSYGGAARVVLCVTLIGAAGVVAYAGSRLRRPVTTAWPGKRTAGFMLAAWTLTIVAFFVGFGVYASREIHDYPGRQAPPEHILPITLTAALITAGVIFAGCRASPGGRLASAAIGAAVAPMIFELPFDVIVIGRTYPSLPPDPWLYRMVFFVPLFLVEISTIALLRLTPMFSLTSTPFYLFALMLVVFGVWAATLGFAYPSTAAPIALNVVAKLLAFAATLTLFFPTWLSRRLRTPPAGPAVGGHGRRRRVAAEARLIG